MLDDYYTFDFLHKKVPLFIQVPCNHCVLCEKRNTSIITQRCEFECECHKELPYFVTLTYAPYSLPKNNEPNIRHIQSYIKRLRDYCYRFYNVNIRFFGTSELGELHGRLHYHFLIWGLPKLSQSQAYKLFSLPWRFPRYIKTVRNGKLVKVRPLFGRIQATQINDPFYRANYEKKHNRPLDPADGIRYCCSYACKSNNVHSWSLGLGSDYIKQHYSSLVHSVNCPHDILFKNRFGRVSKVIVSRWFLDTLFKSFNRSTYRLRSQLYKSLSCLFSLPVDNRKWFVDKLSPFLSDVKLDISHVKLSSFRFMFNHYRSRFALSSLSYKDFIYDFFRWKTCDFSLLTYPIQFYINDTISKNSFIERYFSRVEPLTSGKIADNEISALQYYRKSLTLKTF